MTPRRVEHWGPGAIEIAEWMRELSDEQLVRLAGAALGNVYSRGLVKDEFYWVYPSVNTSFHVQVRHGEKRIKPGYYPEWPDR